MHHAHTLWLKVTVKLLFSTGTRLRLFRLCNQQPPKLPQSSWGNLVLSILFTSSSAACFSINNGAALASDGIEKLRSLAPQLPRESPPKWLENLRNMAQSADSPQQEVKPSRSDGDAELGTLRLRELEVQPPQSDGSDPELGTLRVQERVVQPPRSNGDPELGTLRMRELELLPSNPKVQPPQLQPTVHLLAQLGYFQTNNIFSGVDPVNDGLISSGLTLWAAPALGPKTNLVTAIDGSLVRYLEQSEFSYNQFRIRAGIRQQLTSRLYGEVGWNNQQLFRAGVGDRFLNENSIRFALHRRDRLTNKLRLDSFYEFRLSNANPDTRSRIINSLSVSLSYYMQRNLQVGLDYQFALSDFTQRQREDEYHRLLGRLTYAASRDSQINVQGGLTLGGSSNPNIDFDNFFFSVTYTVELGNF